MLARLRTLAQDAMDEEEVTPRTHSISTDQEDHSARSAVSPHHCVSVLRWAPLRAAAQGTCMPGCAGLRWVAGERLG